MIDANLKTERTTFRLKSIRALRAFTGLSYGESKNLFEAAVAERAVNLDKYQKNCGVVKSWMERVEYQEDCSNYLYEVEE